MDAKDAAGAVGAVEAVAAIMGKIPNSKVKGAAKAVKAAAPVIGVAVQAAPVAAKYAGPAAKKAGHAVVGAAEGAKGKLADAVNAGKAAAAENAEKRKAAQQLAAERGRVLSYAAASIDANAVPDRCFEDDQVFANAFASFPGCYVAATYGKAIREKELDRFREVHVFYAGNMGDAIRADIAGKGDPDVYADVKYKQHVRFFLYPCSEEDAPDLLESLKATLLDGVTE